MNGKKIFAMKPILWLPLFCLALFCGQIAAQPKQQLAKAQKLATEGDKFYRQKDYRTAIARYGEAISLAPNYPYAYISKGYSHYNLGEYAEAVSNFDKALEQGYKKIDVYTIRWQANYFNKDYDAALRDALAGLQIQPSSVDLKLGAADSYRAKDDCRSALPYYKSAAESDAGNADVYYFISYCHNRAGEYAEQEAAALKAVERGTKFKGESRELIGLSLQMRRRYEEAAKAYEQALQEKPDLPTTYGNLAEVYRIMNRYDDAINTVKRYLKLNPEDGNSYVSLSWYFSLSNRHPEAITAAKNAIRLLPEQYMGYTNLCRAYNDTKQYAAAVQYCTKALDLKPDDGETNLYLARAYEFQGKTGLATETFKKAVNGMIAFTQQNPDYADGFYLLGNAYYTDGQIPSAITAYKRALELSPNFPKARYNLGMMYIKSGNKNLAREQYNALLNIDTDQAAKLLTAINGK